MSAERRFGRATLGRASNLFGLGAGFLAANLRGPRSSLRRRPDHLCFYVTYRCNMRCRMCGIWTRQDSAGADELSTEDIDRLLADPLFADLEYVNINGGEPNLRADLLDLAALFLERFPRLKAVSLNSNGLPAETCVRNVRRMSELYAKRRVHLSVSISLHKVGPDFDAIAGIPDAYHKVMRSLEGLREARGDGDFYLSVNCVMTPLNIRSLPEMAAWSEREKIPVNFALGEVRDRFCNAEMSSAIRFRDEEKKPLVEFLRGLARQKRTYRQHALRYDQLADIVERGEKRTLACHYAMGGVVLGSDGLLYYCKNCKAIGDARARSAQEVYFDPANIRYKREELFRTVCPVCPPYTYNLAEVKKDLLKILGYLGWG